jgi:hypothetical protein
MNRVLAAILAVVLLGIGGLTGGCSILFSPMLFDASGGDAMFILIWLAGLLIGGLAIWGAVRLFQMATR